MQLSRPAQVELTSCGPAVLKQPQLAVQKLPAHCHLSTPEKQRGVLPWSACAHTRRQTRATDCVVRDRETLWGWTEFRGRVQGALSQRNETQSSKQRGLDSLCANVLHVQWRFDGGGEEVKEEERGGQWAKGQTGDATGWWAVCVCLLGQLEGLKGLRVGFTITIDSEPD